MIREKSVRTVTAIFKVAFFFCISCWIPCIAAANQNDGKAVLRWYPYNTFMTVNEAILSFREFLIKKTFTSHTHQFMVRTAKSCNNSFCQNPFFFFFTAKSSSWRIDQIYISIYQWMFFIILKISSLYNHAKIPLFIYVSRTVFLFILPNLI